MMGNAFRNLVAPLLMTGIALASAPQARAEPACDPGKLTARADRTINYMPFSERAETITIRIDGSADAACRIVLRLSSGSGGVLLENENRLDMDIRTRQGRLLRSDGSDHFPVTLLPVTANGVSADLVAVIPPRQSVPPGLYEGAFEVEVVSGEGVDQTASFSLAARVASQADIRLAAKNGGTGGRGVDFGALESGREGTTFVSVRSNSAYAVELESRNGWFLVLAGPGKPDERIAYATWFNGFPVPRQAVARLPERYEPSSHDGRLNQLQFRIGDVAGKPAGLYEDTVRLTVILLE